VNQGAAQAWFVAGTIPFTFAGGLHALYALVDTVRPTYFVPRDRSVQPALEGTRIRFGGDAAPSMWRAWLVGLLCLLIAIHDSKLIEVLSLRFWFYGPAILTGSATACFTIATVLSA
jgi:hypothetical protein